MVEMHIRDIVSIIKYNVGYTRGSNSSHRYKCSLLWLC